MQIVNQRPYALVIAATDQRVEPGDTAEVPDDVGRSLLDQPDNWAPAKTAKRGQDKE